MRTTGSQQCNLLPVIKSRLAYPEMKGNKKQHPSSPTHPLLHHPTMRCRGTGNVEVRSVYNAVLSLRLFKNCSRMCPYSRVLSFRK